MRLKGAIEMSEFPLFVFTLLGGIAAGAYVFAWAFPEGEDKKHWKLPLFALILLAIGGVALLSHLGHPLRMFYAFSNPNAGITREGVTTGLFGVLVLICFIFSYRKGKIAPKAVGIVTALAGLLLLVAMGSAYIQFYGVPAWSGWPTMPLFIVGGLSAGICVLPLFDDEIANKRSFALCAAIMNILFACTSIAVGVHFTSLGLSIVPFIVAAVIAVLAAVISFGVKGRKSDPHPVFAFFLAFVAVTVARYAFYLVV